MTSKTADALLFFRAWLSAPLQVASVTPSGRALSSLITTDISADTGTVIELGPGTGVFTEALLDRGVAESNLVLVEYSTDFAGQLSQRFPTARTIQMDAAKLRKVVLQASGQVGAVVSGLPLLSMPMRKVIAILEGAFSHLRQDGAFYQFTYGLRCPIPRPLLDLLGLKATFVGRALANVPPAAVYRVSRRRSRPPLGRTSDNPLSVGPHASLSSDLDRSAVPAETVEVTSFALRLHCEGPLTSLRSFSRLIFPVGPPYVERGWAASGE